MVTTAKPDVGEGLLEAGLQAVFHGTPGKALQAIKCLNSKASSCVFRTRCLEQDGIIRATLKVPDAIQHLSGYLYVFDGEICTEELHIFRYQTRLLDRCIGRGGVRYVCPTEKCQRFFHLQA